MAGMETFRIPRQETQEREEGVCHEKGNGWSTPGRMRVRWPIYRCKRKVSSQAWWVSLFSDLPRCHFLVIKEFLFQSLALGGNAEPVEEGASLRKTPLGSLIGIRPKGHSI